jgi:hypothetical protein
MGEHFEIGHDQQKFHSLRNILTEIFMVFLSL